MIIEYCTNHCIVEKIWRIHQDYWESLVAENQCNQKNETYSCLLRWPTLAHTSVKNNKALKKQLLLYRDNVSFP